MALTIYSCVTYVPNFDGTRTQDHWAALHFAKAIKGTPLAGYATLSTRVGEVTRIDRTTAGAAPEWFADLAVHAAPWTDLLPCGLVPVPDAACDLAAACPRPSAPLVRATRSHRLTARWFLPLTFWTISNPIPTGCCPRPSRN